MEPLRSHRLTHSTTPGRATTGVGGNLEEEGMTFQAGGEEAVDDIGEAAVVEWIFKGAHGTMGILEVVVAVDVNVFICS